MKKLILTISVLFLGITLSIGQDATLSMGDYSGLNPGDNFLVSITLDYIDNSGTPNCDGMQIFVLYDPLVVNVVTQSLNLNPNIPSFFWNTNVPTEGDWRGLFTNFGPPVALSSGEKICDIEFQYLGGGTPLDFDNTAKDVGGKLEKGVTFIVVPGNIAYNMTLISGSVMMGGGTPGLWTGAVDSDWTNVGNWDDGALPAAGINVTIPVTANDPMINAGVLGECGDMQIDAGATLTIVGDLTAGAVNNDGMLMMDGGSLLEAGLSGTGMFQYSRFLANGAPGTHAGWHFVSSPVDNTVTGDFIGYWVNGFDPTAGAEGEYFPIDAYPGDCSGSTFVEPIAPGMGYSVKQDLDYTGTSPTCPTGITGDVIEFGGDFMSTPACTWPVDLTDPAMMANVNTGVYNPGYVAGAAGYNLLGNPYPSGLNWDMVAIPGTLNNAVYYWNNNLADPNYATYVDGVGTNGGTNEIPATQGFLVNATGAGAVTFDNTMRIHAVAPYYKSEVSDILRLVASANNFTDETVIRFTDAATTGFDKQFDAYKLLSGGSEVPSLYTYAGSEMISINSQPATTDVPMAFTCAISGTYTIEATETSEFADVTLIDNVTGEQTDLLTSSYTFDYTAGENADRFVVHFGALGTIENNFDNVSIWSNENNIYVNVPMITNGDIVVVNMMGQEIIRTDIATGMNVIPINDVNSYYIVKVIGSEAVKTGKVYIK